MDVMVIVGTFGSSEWYTRGHAAAAATREHHGVESIHVHDATLADARNQGARLARSEWLCFLDADDALGPGYFPAMAAAASPATLLAPAVAYGDGPAVTFADRELTHLNPCVIGTLVERDVFLTAGGFYDEAMYEDWSLWLRCATAGATIVHVPEAVYEATPSVGRNTGTLDDRRRWYNHVQRHYVPPLVAARRGRLTA